ncbi:hypothetical protein EI94DRAFT_1755560 [Lactarius quietus]|nr:hypothetical protein EI94DRAFT_1755560 [Lactarius quietus]
MELLARVRKGLSSSLLEFRKSGAPDVVKNLRCGTSLAEAPHVFDLIEFENVRAHHIKVQLESQRACLCAGISNSVICAFWDALTVVVHGEIEKAELTLALVKEEPTSEKSDPPLAPLSLNVADANIILRSSDQVNFRAHKSVLAISALSPPASDGELEDGLPVIQLSEDAGLLNILVPLLYPTSTMIPSSYEKVFALLAACQKYDMASIQSNIRAEIKRRGSLTPLGSDAFRPFALASRMTLIPEMESTARLTLGYPMTFESLGEGLRSFHGRALCDLVRYRKRCRDNLVLCLDSFFDVHSRCQIWEGCQESKTVELGTGFTRAISSPSYILEGICGLKDTRLMLPVHTCELEDELAQALNQVNIQFHF